MDAILYADVGMDAFSYFLAFARLAPVQCVTWGHPVTTGISTVDYFISGCDLEIDDAEQHYSEKLVRLPGLPTYYQRPDRPSETIGIRPAECRAEDASICPQTLFKLHPDFDGLIASLLRANRRGTWHSSRPINPPDRKAPPQAGRKLPRCAIANSFPAADVPGTFPGSLASADVILDPLHFSGGNTTFEALAMGTPIVTLPGTFMRVV